MAAIRLEPPPSFSFKALDQSPKWKRRFAQYRLASGLSTKSDERQTSTLLYCMDEDAEDTLTSTDISAEDRRSYAAVIAKFDAFFQVRKNSIFEHARFNRRSQKEEESVEQFITSLYSLAESYDYGAMKDEMIRDCIVVGIQDNSLSEHMQMESDLTLEKAKRMVRQREAVHEHQEILRKNQGERSPECEKPAVDSLRRTYQNKQPRRPPLRRKSKPSYQNRYSRCGKGQDKNVLLQRQCAIHAKGKGITVLNASQNQLQMYLSPQRMRMTLPT